MRTLFINSISLLIIALLNACNFPKAGMAIPNVTEEPDTASTNEIVESAQDSISTECAFLWANEPLPELSDDFNQALKSIAGAEGYAQAYGENCVTVEGEVARFLAMETDFYITLQVEDLENKQALGELVEQVMGVIEEFPVDETPGPQPGYVGFTFETTGDELRLWLAQPDVEAALKNGLQGEELFNFLQEK